ncbi:MAG: tetratricopeptide repeat protein [Syntrophales bacterium]|nr:tetratricopeptide repeat protein [Syntrophales bacterium]
MTVIKREDVGAIAKALNDCDHLLQRKNLYSSIVKFREALEKMMVTPMLPADEKSLNATINEFQERLSSSRVFYESYGPVTFRDNDIETAADFMRQLMEIKEEEIQEEIQKAKDAELENNEGISKEILAKAKGIRIIIERGDYAVAREMIGDDEDLLEYIVSIYNEKGIDARKSGQFDLAISEFRKVVSLCPDDEGLYYNLARVYLDKKEWDTAEETIAESLIVNEAFPEGLKLLAYIRANKPKVEEAAQK